MMAYLEEAACRSVNAHHLLFLVESIRATDRAGREQGAEPLCSAEEEGFMAAVERELIADRPVSLADGGRLHSLFGRAGGAPHPVLGSLKWLGVSVRLLDAVSASLREHRAHEAS
jgi:hypothetical protein